MSIPKSLPIPKITSNWVPAFKHMRLLLNTIMLEVNRWTADKILTQPLADLLPNLQTAGFNTLEIWQYHISRLDDDAFADLKIRLDEHALQIVALSAYPLLHLDGSAGDDAAAELERIVVRAATLGATTCKIFPGRIASAVADDTVWHRSIDRLRVLAERLGHSGMDLTLETHKDTLCDTLESTTRLLTDLSDVANLGICFQPYASQNTEQVLTFYDVLAPTIRHIHLQNRTCTDNVRSLLADGDWYDCGQLLRRARARGFDGLLSLEFTAGLFPQKGQTFDPQTVIDNAIIDRQFVRNTWKTD